MENWLKLTLKSSFLNLKLSKLMSRLSVSPPRNLIVCCPHKNLHMIRPVQAIPEKEASSNEPKKEARFILAKNEEKLKEVKLEIETPAAVKRTIGAKPKEKGKLLPKNQRGPQVKHVCHHCGVQGHTRPNCFKLHVLKKANSMHGQESSKKRP